MLDLGNVYKFVYSSVSTISFILPRRHTSILKLLCTRTRTVMLMNSVKKWLHMPNFNNILFKQTPYAHAQG